MLEVFISHIQWPALTIFLYLASRWAYGRWHVLLLSPLIVVPTILIVLTGVFRVSYADYIGSTHWLVALLGPVTVAFAVPLWNQRSLVRQYWLPLLAGAVVGSAAAIMSAWAVASVLSIDGPLRLSLLPRSISTPFAISVSGDIGGVADLTAVFVIVTGILGAVIGQIVTRIVPLRSSLSRGAMFGMGAHGAGVAKANEIGEEEGTIASLMMVAVGLLNVLLAPLINIALHALS